MKPDTAHIVIPRIVHQKLKVSAVALRWPVGKLAAAVLSQWLRDSTAFKVAK